MAKDSTKKPLKSKREITKLDTTKLKPQKKTGPVGYSLEDKVALMESIIDHYANSDYTIDSICSALGTSYDTFYGWLNGLSPANSEESGLNVKHFQTIWSKAKKQRLAKDREKMVEAGQQYLHQFIQNPILRKTKTLIIKKGTTNSLGGFEALEDSEAYQHTTIEEYEQPNSVLAILTRIDPEGYGGKVEGDDGEIVVKFETSPAPIRKEEKEQ